MLVFQLPIPADKEPDWDRAEKWVAALTADELNELAVGHDWEAEGAKEQRAQLAQILADFRKEIEGSREVAVIQFLGHKLYLTGGLSWGESPTDAWDVFERAVAAGVARQAGFDEIDTNAVKLVLG